MEKLRALSLEDVYFYKKDRELIEQLKRDLEQELLAKSSDHPQNDDTPDTLKDSA